MLFVLMHKAPSKCDVTVCGTSAEDIKQAFQMMSNAIQITIDNQGGKSKHIQSDHYTVTFKSKGLTHYLYVKPLKYCSEVM